MKKIIGLTLCVFVGGGCASSSFSARSFNDFEIRKLTGAGLERVKVRDRRAEWPDLTREAAVPLKINSQNIRIAVMGDTGCRLKEWEGGAAYQHCRDGKDWIFPQLALALEREHHELLIHTGDYHYREQCTAAACSEITPSVGYGWPAWWDDFYGPAQGLFKKTPLIAMRGNHEECGRAHRGWAPLASVPATFEGACVETEPFQWIEMGDLVLINFDNAAFEDRAALTKAQRDQWRAHLQKLAARISETQKSAKKEIWLLAHHPAFAYVPDPKTAEPFGITENFSSLLKETGLLKQIDYILSGHIHNQQLVPRGAPPLQLVVGNSGTALDAFGRVLNTPRVISTTERRDSYGYALLERQGFKHWKMTFKDARGESVMTCRVEDHRAQCE